MRCFIAIDLPEELKRQIEDVITQLSPLSKGIKWVPSGNIHLTLKFLGEIKEDMLPDIRQRLDIICRICPPFALSLRGSGAFPDQKNPNVLWIGVDRSEELKNLYNDIDNSMSEIGFEKESRKHSPHLTIGRVKNKKDVLQAIKGLSGFSGNLFGKIEVAEIHLMKSVLMPTGAEYSKICSFRLNGDKKA